MPSYILKPVPDVDFYVDWTTVSDGPCEWGSRAELKRSLSPGEWKAERFKRADKTGTSSLPPLSDFRWGQDIWLYQHFGDAFGGLYEIPRENVPDLCRRIDRNSSQTFDIWDIANVIDPADDDE